MKKGASEIKLTDESIIKLLNHLLSDNLNDLQKLNNKHIEWVQIRLSYYNDDNTISNKIIISNNWLKYNELDTLIESFNNKLLNQGGTEVLSVPLKKIFRIHFLIELRNNQND